MKFCSTFREDCLQSTVFFEFPITTTSSASVGKQLQDMEALADTMGHDVQTAQTVYIKDTDTDEE